MLARDLDYNDFGTVRMPSQPLQREDHEERIYNVLVLSLIMGSAKKVTEAVAHDFSKTKWPSGQPMFNVTLVTDDNN